jgi:hypothetical protein
VRIITVWFDNPERNTYERLFGAFRRSITQHMPDVPLEVIEPEAPSREGQDKYGFLANTLKLKLWLEALNGAEEGEHIIFADCDMLAMQSAEHAFDVDFDIAYTRRAKGDRVPINSGIVMVRNNEPARAFIQRWRSVNDVMYYEDKEFHAQWKKRYPGMNQAAFGYLLENDWCGAKLHEYSTRQWNAVECDWSHIGPETVFVHFKGQLRRKAFSGRFPHGIYSDVLQVWYGYAGLPLDARSIRPKGRRRANVRRVLNKHKRLRAAGGAV